MKIFYKILAVIFITYTIAWGLISPVPRLNILHETIRNLFYHVPIWFAMLFMMTVSVYQSIKTLSQTSLLNDSKAYDAAFIGFFFAMPGLATGCMWAKYTWGTWFTFQDPKLSGVAITILIYLAYFILRSSLDDEIKKARLSAVYNIFAYVMMIVFIMILPRLKDSLHPGNGGNPAFSKYDLNDGMRLIFYPAVIGWICMSYWLFELKNRISILNEKHND